MVGHWVDPGRKHSRCSPRLQGTAHLQAKVVESDLGHTGSRALLLNMELGYALAEGPLHTGLVPGERWKGAGHGCTLSMVSLCLGSPVITTRAEAKVLGTKTR